MTAQPDSSAPAEETRIRAAYSRRPKDDRYSWFSAGHLFLMQERERRVLETLRREGFSSLQGKTILEIGCGTGQLMREFIKWGAEPPNVTGLDLLADRVAEARALCPSQVRIECANASDAAFPDGAFDLVIQSTVFTSILDRTTKQHIATEMMRLVKPTGLILWYDFHVNNPANPDVRGVSRRELFELFPDCRFAIQRLTLAPPLLRRVARHSWLLCHLLSKIPWLCTHHLAVIRKR